MSSFAFDAPQSLAKPLVSNCNLSSVPPRLPLLISSSSRSCFPAAVSHPVTAPHQSPTATMVCDSSTDRPVTGLPPGRPVPASQPTMWERTTRPEHAQHDPLPQTLLAPGCVAQPRTATACLPACGPGSHPHHHTVQSLLRGSSYGVVGLSVSLSPQQQVDGLL